MRAQSGMTLVELMVVVVISSIVGIAMLNLFVTSNQTYMDQSRILDAQRDGRLIMEFIARTLREAGLNPLGNDLITAVEEASATKVRITSDRDMDGVIAEGQFERLSFDFDNARGILRRGNDETTASEIWVDMVRNVSAFSLSYLDADNVDIGAPDTAAKRASIRTVIVTIRFRDTKLAGGDFDRSYSTRVRLRNL